MLASGYYVYLLFLTTLVLFVVALHLSGRDLIAPSVVTLGLFLVGEICFIYQLPNWYVVFTLKAYLLFVLAFVIMIMVEHFFRVRGQRKSVDLARKKHDFTLPQIRVKKKWDRLIVASVIVASVAYVLRTYFTGVSLGAEGLQAIGFAKEKGEFDSVARLLLNYVRFVSLFYALILFQRTLGQGMKLRRSLPALSVIICCAIVLFFSGQRSVLIGYLFGLLVLAGIVVHDSRRSGRKINVGKYVRFLVVAGVLILIFFVGSREAVKGISFSTSPINYLTYYLGNTIALMGRIVEDPSICHTPFAGYFGEKTFNGFWSFAYSIGLVDAAPCERIYVNLGDVTMPNRTGNEFTFLCGPYIDFGFFGALLFVLLFYAAFSYVYYCKILNTELTKRRYVICVLYSYFFVMVSMAFFQDTIRTMVRPIILLYIIFVCLFAAWFIEVKQPIRTNKLEAGNTDKGKSS